jgi:hypothetical protein
MRQAILIVDHPETGTWCEQERQDASPMQQAALTELATRFANSPMRRLR